MPFEVIKKKRLQYLKKLYDFYEKNRNSYPSMNEIGQELGFDMNEVDKIVGYLVNEGLVDYIGIVGGNISITHEGIKEIESALDNPQKSTEHFPPINVIQIGTMMNSQIQQSTKDSNQSQNINQMYTNALNERKKIGYTAGAISIFIGIIFLIMVLNFGWGLTGQILTAFSALFSILGIGSLIKPESVGQITAQILQNISENTKKQKNYQLKKKK